MVYVLSIPHNIKTSAQLFKYNKSVKKEFHVHVPDPQRPVVVRLVPL